MPVNLGSNKQPYKKGPDGKLQPNPSERATSPTPLNSSGNYQGQKQPTLAVGGNKQQRDAEIIRYPLNRQESYPASIKFEPYIVDAYKVGTEGLRDIMDAPLLERFIRDASGLAQSTSDGSTYDEIPSTRSVNPDTAEVPGYDDAPMVARQQQQAKAEQAMRADQIEKNKKEMGSKLTDLRAYRDPEAPTLILYLPPGLQYVDAVNYNDTSLGAAGLTALAGIGSRKSITSAIKDGLTEGIESIFNLARGTLSQQAAQVTAARASQLIPNAGIRGAAQLGLQTGLNPGTRMLFDKPNVRRFTFSFKMIATSSQEASQIEDIVKNFRYQAYPEEIDINNIPIGYNFPNVFRISMQFGGTGMTPHIPRLQYCYLETVNTTYNGNADVFYADGHPTEVDLSLNFVEYRPLSKRDVEAGF